MIYFAQMNTHAQYGIQPIKQRPITRKSTCHDQDTLRIYAERGRTDRQEDDLHHQGEIAEKKANETKRPSSFEEVAQMKSSVYWQKQSFETKNSVPGKKTNLNANHTRFQFRHSRRQPPSRQNRSKQVIQIKNAKIMTRIFSSSQERKNIISSQESKNPKCTLFKY